MHSHTSQSGFTLLEMIAALGVFSVVIVIFSSTFLNLLNAEGKAQIASNFQDNLRFTLEVMAKEVRTGTGYVVPASPANTVLTFLNVNGQPVTYRLSEATDGVCQASRCIGKEYDANGDGTIEFLPLTSDQITADDMRFSLSGIQPRLQITVRARAKIQNIETAINLQTTVSQRKVVNQP